MNITANITATGRNSVANADHAVDADISHNGAHLCSVTLFPMWNGKIDPDANLSTWGSWHEWCDDVDAIKAIAVEQSTCDDIDDIDEDDMNSVIDDILFAVRFARMSV